MDPTSPQFNMVENQIRTGNVVDPRVLELFRTTPRNFFVPEKFQALAYADFHIPLDHGQCMLTPLEEGRILQALQIESSEIILEIGTGSGFFTCLLAQLGRHVYSVDIFPEFIEQASQKLRHHGVTNVTLDTGNAADGWNKYQPYDVIVITGSLLSLSTPFKEALREKGRLFCLLGESPAITATVLTKKDATTWMSRTFFETTLPPLIHAPQKDPFQF